MPRANAAATRYSYDPSAEAAVPAELKNAHALLRSIKIAVSQCEPIPEVELDECTPPER